VNDEESSSESDDDVSGAVQPVPLPPAEVEETPK